MAGQVILIDGGETTVPLSEHISVVAPFDAKVKLPLLVPGSDVEAKRTYSGVFDDVRESVIADVSKLLLSVLISKPDGGGTVFVGVSCAAVTFTV